MRSAELALMTSHPAPRLPLTRYLTHTNETWQPLYMQEGWKMPHGD